MALNTYLIDKILNEFANVYDRLENFKQDFENKIKQFTYNKMKYYEKCNYNDIAGSKDFSELMKIDIVSQIICEEC